jgi:hypothetical protein
LAVHAKGGPWPEHRENRIRQRHAVASALFESRFHTDQFRKLNIARVESGKQSLLVPFELFSRACRDVGEVPVPPWCRAVVLWLDSEDLGSSPLKGTHDVLEAFRACEVLKGRSDAFVLGPVDSGMLRAMLNECKELDRSNEPPPDAGWPLRVLSAYSTAPFPPQLFKEHEQGDSEAASCVTVKPLRALDVDHPYLQLTRTIGRDDAIAELLVSELQQRIPELMSFARTGQDTLAGRIAGALRAIRFLPPRVSEGQKVPVAIVAEQDTEYGRAWYTSMVRAANDAGAKIDFKLVPYIGGIDGQGLGPSAVQATSSESELPYAVGPSQIDYLQRLQGMLDRNGSYAAIGVFGSDVYDALMILEALRPQFPEALFFTVDLDSRFLHPVHLPYTRNVIVASHLSLGEAESPQFRDLYQYSAYRTIRSLLGPSGQEPEAVAQALGEPPHLYEIGTRRAVELNTAKVVRPDDLLPRAGYDGFALQVASSLFGSEVWAGEATKGSENRKPLPGKRLAFSALVLLGLVYLAGFAPREDERPHRWLLRGLGWLAFLALCGLACALLLWSVAGMAASQPIEPIELFEGVSVWPAVFLRLFATVFALAALVWIPRRLARVHREIEGLFHLEARAPVRLGVRQKLALRSLRAEEAWRMSCGFLRNLGLRWIRLARWLAVLDSRERPLPAQEVWRRVGHWIEGSGWRWARLLIYTIIGYVALGTFFQLSPMSSPVRGELSFLIERSSVLAMVISFLALCFFVLEAHVLCWRLIARLGDPRSVKLPEAMLKVLSAGTPLDDDHADRVLRIRLVARLTKEVDSLIYYPIVLVCAMIAARASIFDSWSWPLVLVGTLAFFFLLMILCALSIRRVAERERLDALSYLGRCQLEASDKAPRATCLAQLRLEIENLRGGAFSPLLDHALVRSAFFPLLAYGATLYAARVLGA